MTNKKLRQILLGALSIAATYSVNAFAASKSYTYKIDGKPYQGLITQPDVQKKIKGGVLIVHNWMGVSEETKKQAQRFANLGYLVLSADIYGKDLRPKNQKEAAKFATKYKSDRPLFQKRLSAAFQELKKQKGMKGRPLFAAGYCFGGTGVIELARTGAKLDGVFSFHGGLDSTGGKKIVSPIIAYHGANDPYVPKKDLEAFKKEMKTNKVDWQLVEFGNAVHSFTDKGAGKDPSKGAAYNKKADMRSWKMTAAFLGSVTK